MKQLVNTALLLWPMLLLTAVAQNGTIQGTITQTGSGSALGGVHVFIQTMGDKGTVAGDYSRADGTYNIQKVPQGTYNLIASYVGCKPISQSVTLSTGENLKLDIQLSETVITLNEVVVSASRRDEKLVDAPAAMTVIPARDIERTNSLSPIEHLRGVQGVDVQQKGIMANEYAARGLNNVFNGNVRTLTDNRITNLPALRANIGYLQQTTNQDIDHIEMVLGPGSALYGPNVTNGVMHTITKSPFASRGTDVSLFGGNQGLLGVTARNAGVITDNLAYKISAQYTTAEEWDPTYSQVQYPDDLKAERYTADARLDYLFSKNGTLTLNAGHSVAARAFDLTDNGPVMAKNFSYDYVQGRFMLGNFFAQAYINMNNAGDTYFLPEVGADPNETMKIVDKSNKIVAEVQHSFDMAPWQKFVYGGDMYFTNPETDGTIMGRNEDDDNVQEFGGYIQSETQLLKDHATLLLAGRVDKHSALDEAVFSPRAGLLLSPARDHNFRVMYNKAFMTPVISELFLDLPVGEDIFDIENQIGIPVPGLIYGLQNTGVPTTGYNFRRTDGDLWFRSEFDPSMQLKVNDAAGTYWQYLAGLVGTQLPDDARILLEMIGAPTEGQVGSSLLLLNLEKANSGDPEVVPFDFVNASDVQDVPRLRPTILNNMELGYNGSLSDDIQVGASWYYSEYEDFITPGRVITPNVFLNGEELYAYLYQQAAQFVPDEDAQAFAAAIAPAMAEIPVGTVTPEEAKDPTRLIMAPINYGTISYWGADVSFMFHLTDNFSIGTNYSFINRNWYDDVDGKGSLSLNVPKHKAALSLHYTELSTSIHGAVRYRFNDGFKVKSGIYEGQINPYGLVDVAVSVPIPILMQPTFNLNVNNLLDHQHREYIGGGNIGRLITAGLSLSM